jgi:FolB domain-containing protein
MPKPAQAYASVLSLNALSVKVSLGVTQEERSRPQDVRIDVRFYLPAAPAAATDDEAKYICYHGIGEKVKALCARKPYRLIEYLTHEIYRLLRGAVPRQVKIGITLTKPVIGLASARGGASYTYTDLPPAAWVAPAP